MIKIKKVFKMAITVFLLVFVFTLLVSYNDSGQTTGSKPIMLPKDTPIAVSPSFLQSSLRDSAATLEVEKKELLIENNRDLQQKAKNRIRVLQWIKELTERPKVIRDTIKIYVPIPMIHDTLPDFSKINVTYFK